MERKPHIDIRLIRHGWNCVQTEVQVGADILCDCHMSPLGPIPFRINVDKLFTCTFINVTIHANLNASALRPFGMHWIFDKDQVVFWIDSYLTDPVRPTPDNRLDLCMLFDAIRLTLLIRMGLQRRKCSRVFTACTWQFRTAPLFSATHIACTAAYLRSRSNSAFSCWVTNHHLEVKSKAVTISSSEHKLFIVTQWLTNCDLLFNSQLFPF